MTLRDFDIKTVADVKDFFKYLADNDLLIHPDDDYKWIIDFAEEQDEEPSITLEQANTLNDLMDKCFEVCDANNADIYELAMWDKR